MDIKVTYQKESEAKAAVAKVLNSDKNAFSRLEKTVEENGECFGLLLAPGAAFAYTATLVRFFENQWEKKKIVINIFPVATSYKGPAILLPYRQIEGGEPLSESVSSIRFFSDGVAFEETVRAPLSLSREIRWRICARPCAA